MKKILIHYTDRVLRPLSLKEFTTDSRIGSHDVVVASSAFLYQCLTSWSDKFEHESGFFRLGDAALPPSTVKHGSAMLRDLLLRERHNLGVPAGNLLTEVLNVKLPTQSTGQYFVYRYFKNVILHNRPPGLLEATEKYIAKSIIPYDIRRRYRTRHWSTERLNSLFVPLVADMRGREQPKDLLDIAIALTSAPTERAELFRRLVLSTVGFTGTALEHLLIDFSRHSAGITEQDSDIRNFVLESLRLNSPAFRLSRTVAKSFSTNEVDFRAGDQGLLNVAAAHLDAGSWDSPRVFNSLRWNQKSATRYFLGFGKGTRSCPAQHDALICLEDVVRTLKSMNVAVDFRRRPLALPLVGTLLAPPAGFVLISPKNKTR